jgi:phospholipase C
MGGRSLAAGLALVMLLAGCTPGLPSGPRNPVPPAESAPPESAPSEPGTAPAASAAPSSPYFAQPAPHPAPVAPGQPEQPGKGGIRHVVVIVLENKAASEILGASEAGYFNQLAAQYALATNYQAIMHPSLPNYLALTSGTNAGITSDCNPRSCTADVRSIADEITQSGRTWKMYAETMPGPCVARDYGAYAVKHNPFVYYPSVTGDKTSCAAHVVPFDRLEQDLQSASSLPDYAFISPNMCHDTHNCPISTGDDWLSRQVPRILGSPAFTTQNSLLVVTWDEGSDDDNRVATVFAGPAARKGFASNAAYSHYSLLHTIEEAWGLPPLTDNDRDAPVMRELLN